MDTFRGNFADRADSFDDGDAYDSAEDEIVRDVPDMIGQDERRMQVRAYNHWAGLLEDRNFPSIDDLDPTVLHDFGPYSVLLDFTAGVENPGISYLGDKLAVECGVTGDISELADVPARSLLSRITDHYMQILANQAPIGFEAEFVNQRGLAILYRGILLPYSSDDDTIDFIYGVINWKEIADQRTTDELMLEIDQALEEEEDESPKRVEDEVMADWADGPVSGHAAPLASLTSIVSLSSSRISALDHRMPESALPMPHFGSVNDEYDVPADTISYTLDEADMGLADWLASARQLAELASSNEDRSRAALYQAISHAYDFSLAAAAEPDEFADLVDNAGLTMQERAPMTPVVKLVFGADYDKTRLTEYAAALMHAHRLELERGTLGEFLANADGGLKGVVKTERALRRAETGKPAAATAEEPRARTARKLRKIAPMGFEAIAAEGREFSLVMIRRLEDGEVTVLGEVSEDAALIERAAKTLLD